MSSYLLSMNGDGVGKGEGLCRQLTLYIEHYAGIRAARLSKARRRVSSGLATDDLFPTPQPHIV